MPLTPGVRLGPYEIVAALGAGGMGEVYRARDTRLDRTVAIKVLPAEFSGDPQLRARFDREARAISSLSHPHICALYDVGTEAGTQFLVLEFLEGRTLADRLLAGPISADEALRIAIQIGDALDKAHRAGIVHRDLKPANVMLTKAGAKLLDFGLAKAAAPVVAASGLSLMPTTPHGVTAQGTILGTFQYMAPEQIEGFDADARTDIFAFGALLFEMLTGRKAFDGKTRASLLGAILKDEPPRVSAVQPIAPQALDRIVATCLAKDPDDRWQSARDLVRELKWVADGAATREGVGVTRAAPPWARVLAWTGAAAAIAFAITFAWRGTDRQRPAPVYASLDAPADSVLGEDDAVGLTPTRTPMVFTPDGRSLIIQAARAGKPQLYLRSLDRPDARPIAGTENARVPFVSPDGKWIAFWTANEIRKVPIEGGTATTVCAAGATPLGPFGAAWGAGDVIVFGDDVSGRIMRVSANGGTPVPVTAPPPIGRRHAGPFLLPDGKRLLFSDVSTWDARESRLMVQALDGTGVRPLITSAVDGRLVPSGQLVFMRLGTLMAVPFDTARAEATGDAVFVMGDVMQSGMRARQGALNTAAGMFAVSSAGALAVIRGPLAGTSENALIWTTRDGRTMSAEPTSGQHTGTRNHTRISPDQSRAIVAVYRPMRLEFWLADWKRDTWTLCADCQGGIDVATWSRDGHGVLLGQNETLVMHALDGSAPDQVLVQERERALVPGRWLADGRIVYQSSPDLNLTHYEIKLLEPGAHTGRVIVPLGMGKAPDVSPDGRWLAYDSTQTGAREVVVQAFPGPGLRTQVSAGGGADHAGSADGRTLYYLRRVEPTGEAILAVDITTTSTGLTAGKPRELFRRPEQQSCGTTRCYDMSADGQRFLFHDRGAIPHASVTRMDLILNWTSTLQK